ncbi:hypothetical protein LCGC14_0594310 [marine sediment metagenome]|uniref:Large polyvalent protein associated domain-containing protein n=1 Tax=marine sediment metagenome TaxID=412755 RepID=A0A0F9RHF2_9ZZZZ
MPLDEWDQAYNTVNTPAPVETTSVETAPKQDEWDKAYIDVIAPESGLVKTITDLPEQFEGDIAQGFMNAAEGLLRIPSLVMGQAKNAAVKFNDMQMLAAEGVPEEQRRLRQKHARSEKAFDNLISGLSETADWHHTLQKSIIRNHPEWESEPPEGIKDLLLRPDKLAHSLLRSTPVLLTAGFLTAAGQPHVATALMFGVESNEAYHEAIQYGESKETANDAAVVYGIVAAALEQMQLKGIMKVGKGAYKSILNRATQKVVKGGAKSVTKAIAITALKEAVEEMAQGQWGEITAKAIYGKKQKGGVIGWVDRRAQEAYVGFMMGIIPGGGGAAAGKIMGGRASQQNKEFLPPEVDAALQSDAARSSSELTERVLDESIERGLISPTEKLRYQTNLTPKQIKQVLKLPETEQKDAVGVFERDNIIRAEQEVQQTEAFKNIGEEVDIKIKEGGARRGEKVSPGIPPVTVEDLIRRGQPDALEEAQTPEDKPSPPGEPPYTLVETQHGLEVQDKQTGRIIEHFYNDDMNSDKKAVKRLKEMNSDPEQAVKYDKSTNGQKARISILGKRLGLIDKKGKPGPAFRRFMKDVSGKTSRKALTWGEAQKVITAMEKHQPTFRVKDKVTPTGSDIVGEVIQINKKRGLATVQFKDKVTGDTNSRIFNMQELAFLGEVQVATEEMIETIRESQKIQTPEERIFGQKENRLLKKHWQNVKRYVTGWHHSLIRVNRMMEWLDGHEKGPNWNRIFRPMYQASLEAEDAINQRFGDIQKFMLDTFGSEGTKGLFSGERTPVNDPKYRDKISLSPAERMGYYVLSKNEDGLRRLKRGNLGSFGNREAALKAILDSVSEQEQAMGDWALEQLKAQYPRANQAAIFALGRELTPADNYFPMYAPAETKDLEQQFDFLTALEEKVGIPKTSMEISETQERVKTSTGPVETDFFRSYFHNFTRVEQFIHMAPAINEVQNLLNNKEYRHILNKATNGYGVKIIHKWMKDTTKGQSTEINNWMGKTLMGLRTNGMIYAIGFNIPSVMRQPLSLGNAMAIDPLMMKYVPINWAKNKQSWGNYQAMDNEVMGKSIMMRNRNFDRVQSTLNNLSAREKHILGKKTYSQKAISWIKWTDRHTTVLVWKSLYDVALERNLNEEQAIAFADDGVSKTQPMGNARDLPDFFRGGALEKLLSTFQNQVNNNYNFWTHDIIGELKAGKTSKKVAAYRVMFSYVIPALLFGMIGRGGPPEDWGDAVEDLALYPLGSLFLVGRIIYNASRGFAGGGTSVAGIGIGELEKTIAAGFRGDIGKVVKHGVKATGALTGRIPAQAIRTAEGAYDLAQNETDDWRRLIYSEWTLSRGDKGAATPMGRKRRLRRRTTRKRKLRRR